MKLTQRRSMRPAVVLLGALLAATYLPVTAESAVAQPTGSGASAIAVASTAGNGYGLAAHLGRGAWELGSSAGSVSKPPSPRVTILNGVFCTSPGNCWAVGLSQPSRGSVTLNQMLHWNGRKWGAFPVPEPGGTAAHHYNTLDEVRCVSARDCWAVGYYLKGGADLDEALHWNGRRWSTVSTPTPGGILSGDLNELYDLSCTSSANCWAVGEFGRSGTLANQALHWNGKRWSLVATPDPGGTKSGDSNVLNSVRCTAASNCFAVGFDMTADSVTIKVNETMHWNGKKWSLQTAPNPGGTSAGAESELVGLGCGSSTSCWAVGFYDTTSAPQAALNEILHWNGRKWSLAAAPDPAGMSQNAVNNLFWVTCVSSRDCWAVGDFGTVASTEKLANQALHWNGLKWRLVRTPDPGATALGPFFDVLAGARCTSAANCWAVGLRSKGGNFVDEILHWNGNKWSTA